MEIVPLHPAYDRENPPSTAARKFFGGGLAKGSREIYKISVDDTVPLRVPIGVDSLKSIANQAESIKEAVDATQKWSGDLSLDVEH